MKLQQQQASFEAIKTLCVNYKKDSTTRKTHDYLNKRLSSLDASWAEFESLHLVLEKEIEDKNINYFSEDIYGKTKAMYETTKSDIMRRLHLLTEEITSVKFDLTGLLYGDNDDDVISLLNKQECNFRAIDRAMSKIDIATISNEKWELEDNLNILKSKWSDIDKLHWEIDGVLKGSHETYYSTFVDIECKHDRLRKELNSKIWSTAHYQKSAPRIEIPQFSGNYNQWISFKDLFIETVHNNPTINNAQKMQHLKTKLRGEAERLVQHLTINAENYKSCWDILKQRYDNRRLQFISFMNTMMHLPVIQQPDSYNIKKMHDVITECLSGLSNIGLDTSTWDPVIVYLMTQKLDTATHNDYVRELQDHREVPALCDFLYFLESKFMAFETMKRTKKDPISQQKPVIIKTFNKEYPAKKPYFNNSKPNSKIHHAAYGQCPLCDEMHVLMQCQKFIDLDIPQRNITVAKLQVCKNCLFSHGGMECKSNKTCKECNLKHHSLLHNNYMKKQLSTNFKKYNYEPKPSTSTQQASNHHLAAKDMEVLLTTVQLQLQSFDGTWVKLRALLDQGSQVNLITENAAQLLQLPRNKLNATVSGIGELSGNCKGKTQLTCKSLHSDYVFKTEALILNKITNNLPNATFKKSNWPHLENLKLADADFNVSRPVDLLLGADVYADIIMDGVLKGDQQAPIAQQTHLGWILCGKLITFNCHVTLINMNELTKFWENEDITQNNEDIPINDECEEYYKQTVQRGSDGKYIVKIPLTPNFEKKLGNSKQIAISQFLQLEKRLQKQTNLANMYKEFIKEYSDLEHMKPSTSTSARDCFLPHHGVLRDNATTTKLRVVFNASQKTSSGYSLNSLQEKGPNLQTDIQALILKWRSYKYAFTADVEKMYRCIWISADQQQLQKIIWRNSPSEMLQEYQLCTITYGTKSAPWLAIRTLKQLAIDDGHKYPAAAETLKNEFYVDDLVSGHNSMEEAKQLQQSLINLLQGGGMNLRKWTTNHPSLTEHLTEDQISKGKTFDFKHEDFMKTLGLSWNPNTDTFMFNWDLDKNTKYPLTKRILLSEISRLYDPLGWYSAVTVTAKLLFQRVWISKLTWDEVLPSDIQEEWLNLKAELPLIRNIQLNRWIGGTTKEIEFLGFCDASEKAFACVIYTRIKDEHGKSQTTLLTAKTRVAPLSQKTTLPKLELCGALLLSQLMKKVIEAYKDYEIDIKAWCDSQVVLAWLQGNVTRWEKYVANRVTKIKEIIPSEKWHYIKSEKNPADCATRGMYPSKLIHFDLWWHGPSLQETDKKQAPANMTCHLTTNIGTIKQEEATLASKHNDDFVNELLEKYSSLTRVIRVTARVLRAIARLRKQKHDTEYLLTSELLAAGDLVTRHAQRSAFPIEYKLLSRNKLITKNSPTYKLQPYLDEKGIIRVGGRLNNSNLPPGVKNPILLPRKGRMTHLVIDHGHVSTLHGGARLALNFIRQRYWILGGNRAVKNQLQNCIRCLRFKQTDHHQLMADLPRQRIIPSRPFTNAGVDFTGNVEVKNKKGRGVKTSKGYIVVFVCLVTKAVHIELTSDMSAETFLAAFERFCARRGTPKHVYSDCGTNFVGASKDLRNQFEEFKQMLNQSSFFDEIGKLEVEWHFNAPAWPSGGGIWESAVKSLKYHLRRVLGEQKLTFEEFTTLLTKIEACLNSRPLCALTEDPDEYFNCLTPGHFLTGSPTMSLPHSDHSDIRNIDLRQRWQLTEHMTQRFWKSWSSDYLSQLQRRSKWNKPTKNIKVDDIVLVKEDNLPPGKWAMGRVIDVHPGADGYVRVTTIKTKTGTFKRPVVKLAPLPLDITNEKYEEKPPQQNDKGLQNNQKKRAAQRKNTTNKQCLLTLFTSLITMCALIASSQAAHGPTSAHITPLESERPVYYDTMGKIQVIHDKWTLLLYYNLTNYWEGMNRMATYLNGVSNWCYKIDPKYCNTTLNQLYHEMEQLQYYNTILLTPHKHLSDRRKRGLIDGVGYLTNDLFGILDQRFAEKYKSDIKAVQNNEKHLLELIKNQTSVVELENKIMKKSEANIKRQFDVIENFMNQTNSNFVKVESTVMATSYFNSAAFSAYLLLNNLKNVQEMLFNSLTDVYKGRIDIHLVTPVNLIEQMNVIAGKLPRTLSLPVDNIREEIKDLYKLLYVKARVTDSFFLFEVHIPLISDEDFTLQRAIPLPMKTYRGTVNVHTSSRYIAVNFHKNTYISLKEEDLKQCVQLKLDNFICNKNLPVFNLHNDNIPCEAKLIGHRTATPCDVTSTSCNDAWIELHSPNAWLAICCDTCTLRVICEDDITSHTMTSSGIVTLPQGCVLQSKYLTIHSLSQYNSKAKMDYDIKVPTLTSSINQIANITYHSAPQLFLTKGRDEDTERIDKTLNDLKKNEEGLPSEMTSHDVHQYAISYFLLSAAIVAVLLWGVGRYTSFCSKSKKRKQYSLQSVKPHCEDIELQPIPKRRNLTRGTPEQEPRPGPHSATKNNIAFDFD